MKKTINYYEVTTATKLLEVGDKYTPKDVERLGGEFAQQIKDNSKVVKISYTTAWVNETDDEFLPATAQEHIDATKYVYSKRTHFYGFDKMLNEEQEFVQVEVEGIDEEGRIFEETLHFRKVFVNEEQEEIDSFFVEECTPEISL